MKKKNLQLVLTGKDWIQIAYLMGSRSISYIKEKSFSKGKEVSVSLWVRWINFSRFEASTAHRRRTNVGFPVGAHDFIVARTSLVLVNVVEKSWYK